MPAPENWSRSSLVVETQLLESSISEMKEKAKAEAERVAVPDNLNNRVDTLLRENPETSWDMLSAESRANSEIARCPAALAHSGNAT